MSDEMKVQTKGFNKKFIFIAVAIIVVGLIAALVFVPRSAKAKKVEEQLNLGAKYLSELDYEQAIVAYEAVIKIDPKCEEAYLALADIYIATGEFDKAEEVLKRAEEGLGESTQAVEAKKQEVLTEKKSAEPIQEPIPSPTSTPIPSPTELPTLAPTNTPIPTEAPTATPTPTQTPEQESEVILPSLTSTPTPVPTKALTTTPTPTAAPAAEGSVRVELKLASDCFTYGNYEEKYVCTGLSEKGYKEFQKHGPTNLVSILLPAVSDNGKKVEGFWSNENGGYGLGEMLTEDSAYVELVCPDSFVTYFGVDDEWIDSYYGHKLKNVVLNDGLETIGACAFHMCTGLTEMKIPATVKKIGYGAFTSCIELSKITLPDSVTYFEEAAFTSCNKLRIESFEMAGKTLESEVFWGVSIGTLKLSGSNATVGYDMWDGAKVDRIVIAEGVEELPSNVFSDCTTVSEVYIPSSVMKIGSFAFEGCTGIKELVLPSSVEEIEWAAFSGCSELRKITLPESITYYGGCVFSGCNNLRIESFELAGKTLGDEEFWGVSIDTVTLSGTNAVVDDGLWDGAKVEKIVIAEGVEELPSNVFSGCTTVSEVYIPSSVKKIGSYAFGNCTGIKEMVLPSSVEEIEWAAFSGCSELQKITLPESITYYGGSVFSGCNNLRIESFEMAGKTLESEVFWGVSIGTLKLSGSNATVGYDMWDGAKVEKIVIAEGIEELPSKVFSGCASVSEIHIPNSVKIIGSYAFENCTGIKELVVPASVTEVGWGAFVGCDGICIVTSRGSAADAYAKENGMTVRYE